MARDQVIVLDPTISYLDAEHARTLMAELDARGIPYEHTDISGVYVGMPMYDGEGCPCKYVGTPDEIGRPMIEYTTGTRQFARWSTLSW